MNSARTGIAGICRSLAVGLVLVLGAASTASAIPIDKRLVVTVRTVCNDAGEDCSFQGPPGNLFYEAEGDKIWAQAGIDLLFVLGLNVNSTALLMGPAGGLSDFTAPLAGPGTTMYLSSSLLCTTSPGCILFGEAWLGAGGLALNMDAVKAFNSGIGRLDTIAHELGHNLGLYTGVGAVDGHDNGNTHFLMATGGVRLIPSALGEICPDPSAAACLDFLSPAHIATARASSLLIPIPEPGAWLMLLAGVVAVGGVARTRSSG
jgi:hypothetical protein